MTLIFINQWKKQIISITDFELIQIGQRSVDKKNGVKNCQFIFIFLGLGFVLIIG